MTSEATQTSLGSGGILAAGTVISGRYRILRLLGAGAMGMVYLAHDETLNLDVALKTLRSNGTGAPESLARFRNELLLARRISHRNVVRIHDIGEAGELQYITMDFVDGQSLRQLLDRHGPISTERAVALAADLADALAEAHRAGIVHRDIKPANVLIGADRAYLTDFGIARSLRGDGLTRTGTVVGTLDYLSPEQAQGTTVDARTDIYSLGLLLYEMLSAERPFAGESAAEILAQRTLAKPRDIRSTGADAPAWIRRIIERCLECDPAERYQSADELAVDLRAGEVPRSGVPGRHVAIAGGAIALVALAIGIAGFWQSGVLYRDGPEFVSSAAGAIAVLPFDVEVDTAKAGSISSGLGELLAEKLAASAATRIVDSNRVQATFDDLNLVAGRLSPRDQALLGDLLDADYLVLGRLARLGASYRLDAELVALVSGDVRKRVAATLPDAAAAFVELDALADGLLAEFTTDPSAQSAFTVTTHPQAARLYADAIERIRRGASVDALALLQRATELAPEFALAWDKLAQVLAQLGQDHEALDAARSAVMALGTAQGRTASMIRARRAALAGEPDEAERQLLSSLQSFPDDLGAKYMLAEIYGESGRLQDANRVLNEIVAASPDHGEAWYLLGKFAILQGRARRAADDYLVKALVIQNRRANTEGKADVVNALGIAQAQLGELDAAAESYREAIELRRSVGDGRGVASALANLARIDLAEGRYDPARAALEEARSRLAEIGDRSTVANLDNELGFLEESRGRYRLALAHYRDAMAARLDLGDARALAESYNNVGYAYYLLGEYDNAAVFNDQALNSYRETDNAEGIMLATQTQGILELARGRYDVALKALLESLSISRELNDPRAGATNHGYIGRVRHLQGQYAAAATSFDEAISGFRQIGDARGEAEFRLRHADMLLDLGMWSRVRELVLSSTALMADDDNPARRSLLLRIDGEYLLGTGDPGTATKKLAEALDRARASSDTIGILSARLALANARRDQKDDDAAMSELRSIVEQCRVLGHARLQLEATATLAGALLVAGDFDEAQRLLSDLLRRDTRTSTGNGYFQLHALLAESHAAKGRSGDAATHWQRSNELVRDAIRAQTDAQAATFRQLPTVVKVLAHRMTGDVR